jgi:hypothetical protein
MRAVRSEPGPQQKNMRDQFGPASISLKTVLRTKLPLKQQSYSSPCSIFSWQLMQFFAQGTASSRFVCISS